ncbi:JmjC domain, hydroxylase-domain-containing protein [Crepidotus variabilis]|uniref:[histone H3]-trimethyl-L-lysine(9) demethylase n=1 Tax=Crepidotus variabilis TaxID=179855 RepID=A0A9P6JRN3_9AGAR|nr:JmjC domain, hydroxylase-domain-containing protein [Crepidotus variabilis]
MTSLSQTSSLTPCGSPTSTDIPVQPDHFYNPNNVQLPLSPGQYWLDPADDPLAQRGIPVFKPTMEDFRDFEGYMNKIECWGNRSGIVKVIPPQEWTEALPPINDRLAEVKIKSPIEQHMFGDRGLFRQQNMEKRKWMSVREWAELCAKEDFQAPSINDVGLASRHGPVPSKPRNTRRTKSKAEPNIDSTIEVKELNDINSLDAADAMQSVPTPPRSEGSPSLPAALPVSRKGKGKVKKEVKEEPKPRAKRVHPTREAREASLADRAARDRAFLEDFDPSRAWLPPDTKVDDYNSEFCQQLERRFWRGLGLGGKPAWYGADTQGSLFTDDTESWNVAHLPSALSRLLPSSSKGLPGVNTPYLYFGMWRATFAWHVEDMDLFSINYIHFGAPKFWYAIPQGRASGLEQAMRNHFPKDTSQCSQFLRHKSFLASPAVLAKDSCKPNSLVQRAGEFVITYPRGYHAGFNLGFNCAESVNFALDSWIEMGRKAKACECVSDSVRIDVDQLLRERDGENDAEWNDSEHFLSEDGLLKEFESPVPSKPQKRKAHSGEMPRPKKFKVDTSISLSKPTPVASSSKPHPRISVTLKLGPRPDVDDLFPCCLCVSTSKEELLQVQDPPIFRKDVVEAAGNPKVWLAHEFCANIIPETWVDVSIRRDGSAEKVVHGVDAIVKDRWNLKCSACSKNRSKAHGAPVQCTKGKCPKAFHVNCAQEGGSQGILFSVLRDVDKEVVLLDASDSPHEPKIDHAELPSDLVPDGGNLSSREAFKVVKKLEVQILCTQHNPAVAALKRANKQDRIRSELLSLPSMSRIKIRVSAGVFEVSLIRVIEETGTVEVLWDQNVRKEFKWGSVVFGNTDIPVQHKPADLMAAPERPTYILPTSNYAPISPAATSQQAIQPPVPPNTAQSGQVPLQINNLNSTLAPQLYANSNRISYSQLAGSYGYGQWAYAASTSPYGSVPQTYPYVGYYGPVASASFPPSSQPPSQYGEQIFDQTNLPQPPQHPINDRESTDSSAVLGKETAQRNTPISHDVHKYPSVLAPVPSIGLQASSNTDPTSQPSTSGASDESSATANPTVPEGLGPLRLGSDIHPTQLTEVLRSNPQLASILWAAVEKAEPINGA